MKAYYLNEQTNNFFIASFKAYDRNKFPSIKRFGLLFEGSTGEFIRLCERRLARGRKIPKNWVYFKVENKQSSRNDGNTMLAVCA